MGPPEYKRKPMFIIISINITTKKIIIYLIFFSHFFNKLKIDMDLKTVALIE